MRQSYMLCSCMHNNLILGLVLCYCFFARKVVESIGFDFCAYVYNVRRYSYNEQTGTYKEIQDEQTGTAKEDLGDAIKE